MTLAALNNFSPFLTLREIQEPARDYYCQLPAFLATLADPDFTREVRFPWVNGLVERLGKARPATGAESLLRFVIHRTYQRGQVAQRPRELGVESPITAYIAWIRLDCPSAAWAHSFSSE